MQTTTTGVKIGNHLSPTVTPITPGCRPQAQFDAICRYHSTHPSAWWCSNPFEPEPDGRVFRSTFTHMYFDPQGNLCYVKVTPTGRLSEPSICPCCPEDATQVVELYGTFTGE